MMQDGQDGIAAAFALLNPAPATDPATATDAAPAEVNAEAERLQGELSAARAEADSTRDTLRRQSLAGKVSSVDEAMRLLNPDRHLNKDGTVNAYALYDDFPALAPNFGPTAPNGGGGPHFSPGATSLDTAIRAGNIPLINYAFDQELKRD